MSNLPTTAQMPLASETIEKVLIGGNLKNLQPVERLNYYNSLCESLVMNSLTRPFDYVEFQGKLVLYLNKGGAEQLRAIRKVSLKITSREMIGDVYVVTASAKLPDGREDESTGAIAVSHLKGEALANAMMKTETKAKRRVTISICGLNMLDESEVDSIEGARRVSFDEVTKPAVEIKNPLKEAKKNEEAASEDPAEYVATFGKFKGMKLKDTDIFQLDNYVQYIQDEADKSGKEIKGQVLQFMIAANLFLDMRDKEKMNAASEVVVA